MKQNPIRSIKDFGLLRAATIILNGGFVVFTIFAHIWTPKGDFIHLYDAFQLSGAWPWIIGLPLLGAAIWPVLFIKEQYSRQKSKIWVLIHSIIFSAALFGINELFMETSDKAPTPSSLALAGIFFLPLLLIIVSALALRRRKTVGIVLPKPTKGRPTAYGRNPLIGLGQDLWSLRRNALPLSIMMLAPILTLVTPGMLKHFLGNDYYQSHLIAGVGISVGMALINYLAQGFTLILAVATANDQKTGLFKLFKGHWRLVISYLGLQLLITLFVAGGLILFLVPGLILAFRYSLAPYILIDRRIRPLAAMKYSSQLMKGNALQVVGVMVVIAAFTAVEVVLQLIWPVAGAAIGGFLLVLVSIASQVYFVKLYRSLEEAKQDGYKGLRAHWLNGVLLVVAVIASIVVWLGAIIWLSFTGRGSRVTYDTPCFRVALPSVYRIDKQSCHLHATTRYAILDYAPLDDDATTVDQLAAHQLQHLYPSSRYRPLPGIGETSGLVDGETAKTYSLFDTSDKVTVTVVFVHTHRTTILEGRQIRNYVLFNGSPAETAKEFNLNEFTNMSIILDDTIKWPPYGGDAYQAELIDAQTAYNSKNFQADINHARNAAALADNDAARALAFEWIGVGYLGISNETAAKSAFEQAISLDPTYTDALNSLSNLSYSSGDLGAALKYADKIIELDDSYADAYNMRAICYDAQGKKREAVLNIQKAVRLDPNNEDYQKNAEQIGESTKAARSSI